MDGCERIEEESEVAARVIWENVDRSVVLGAWTIVGCG